jgi:Lon protease-like protein
MRCAGASDRRDVSEEIPLFPLNTVLFPGGPLPLRIFEPRYVDMVRRCMREGVPFGVLLIRAGTEVGEVTSTADVGTSARIVDFHQMQDGLLGIVCLGERRFRVLARRTQPDGLHLGDVEWLPDQAGSARLAEILPISLADKQSCLEMDDPVARLERLAPLIRKG